MHFMMTPDFDEKSSNFNEPHLHLDKYNGFSERTSLCVYTVYCVWLCESMYMCMQVPNTFSFVQHSVSVHVCVLKLIFRLLKQ